MGFYSLDLRTRVMSDVQDGMSADEAAVKYSISARTIYAWKSLLKETGGLTPRQGPVGRPRKLEEHREAILLAIDRKSDLTLEELKSQLNLPGCVKTLWNALQRWGIVLKKSLASRRAEAA